MSLEQPRLFNKHFAADADPKTLHTVPDVPNPNDIAQRPSLASYSTGFPPRSMAPPQAGGQPFYGQDVNGILKDVSANVQYMQAGNYYPFNADFQKAVGGYNKFAVLLNPEDGKLYQSLVDDNTAPLSDNTKWFFFTEGKYLPLTGGTVTGDTNFTAKLQNKGKDVATVDQIPPSIGVGQKWNNVTNEIGYNVQYINTSKSPIFLTIIRQGGSGGRGYVAVSVNDLIVIGITGDGTAISGNGKTSSTIIPSNSKYAVTWEYDKPQILILR